MIFLLCFLMHLVSVGSGCNDTEMLRELDRRARNYIADGVVDPYLNDYLLSSRWYSVYKREQQYIMPDANKMPDYFTCGGHEPIYIDGTHPDPESLTETPTDLVACLRSTFDDCDYQYNIKIRKCSDEIQYYLVPPKQHSAYCMDPPELQDGDGNFSPPPTDVNLGTVSVVPNLEFQEEEKTFPGQPETTINYTPNVQFRCDFNEQNDYFYAVNWYLNNNVYKVLAPTQTTEDLLLTEQAFLDDNIALGFTLRCGVRVSQDATGHSTTMVSSPEFFAGMKVLNPRIELPKDDEQVVQLQLTVPLGCRYNSHTDEPACDMGLSMFDPVGYKCNEANIASLKVSDSHKCGQDLTGLKKGESWDPDRMYHFNVTTTDENYQDRIDFVLQLRMDKEVGHKWWSNYQPDNIKIIVEDVEDYKDKVCYSHVDPHMKTADGYHYENQVKGEFLLYRNTKFDIEVLEKTQRCNSNHALCTCGIIIRAGADVFAINLCGKVRFIEFLSCEDGGILKVVRRHLQKYHIFTPIGTWIEVSLQGAGTYNGFMNVNVMMAPKDVKKTEGLCGYMDGFQSNDLKHRDGTFTQLSNSENIRRHHKEFSNSWKLTEEENLFKTYKHTFNKWQETNAVYCVCEQAFDGSTGTTGRVSKALCSPSQYLDCILNHGPEKGCTKQSRRKRSIHQKETRELERLLRLSNQDSQYRVQRNIEEENITETEAVESCGNAINGSTIVVELSEGIPGEDTNAVIDQCVFDVMAGNDFSLAGVHVDALNDAAQMKFGRDPVFVANNTEKVKEVIQNSCPGNCTQRGSCSEDGICECDPFYRGPDCGIDVRVPVNIDDLEGGGLCNLTDGDGCECFVFRTQFLLPNFTCAISGVVIYIDGTEETFTLSVETGDYEDIFTGLCCVPENREKRSAEQSVVFSTRYDISVSNDGLNFGPAEPLHVYTSDCQEAVSDTENGYKIVLKTGFCFVDGMCVANREHLITDDCLTCEPHVNVYSWTRSCKPTEVKEENIAVILGAAIGSVAGVLLIIGLLALWHFKLKHQHRKRKSVGDSQMFSQSAVAVTTIRH